MTTVAYSWEAHLNNCLWILHIGSEQVPLHILYNSKKSSKKTVLDIHNILRHFVTLKNLEMTQ